MITTEALAEVVEQFVLTGKKGERFGPYFCRALRICDPMVSRQTDDVEALNLIAKRWVERRSQHVA